MKHFKEYATQEEYLADIENLGVPNVVRIGNGREIIYENYLKFEDPEVRRICSINWGDYIETVVADNGDDTVNITRTPISMKNTTAKRGRPETEYNVDNTPDESGNTPYEVGTTKEPVGISKRQCEAVTTLGQKFRNTPIVKFNEFKYFTGITVLSSYAFYSATTLAEITLPDTVTYLDDRCFQYARSLEKNKSF